MRLMISVVVVFNVDDISVAFIVSGVIVVVPLSVASSPPTPHHLHPHWHLHHHHAGVLTLVNNYGVIGLYVSVILVIGRFVRVWSVGSIHWIPITNIPFVERLYNLCLDIYLVRQAGEYAFEELLFAKLNFLFRSNETMIGWTRHPKPKPKNE